MMRRGGGIAALCALLAGCAAGPDAPSPWDPVGNAASLGVAPDDPWCVYMRDLRAHLDGAAPRPGPRTREAELIAVRNEAATLKNGDPLWPFRKAMICEYLDGSAEERAEFDWGTAAEFVEHAHIAATASPPDDGISALVPVFDHLDGRAPESLSPVDLTTPTYCEGLESSELGLSQQRGGVVDGAGFPGSLRRAPDWFAHVQVSYHRWAREHLEGHQFADDDVDFGGVPFHCRRFHSALDGSKEFAVKDNLIFLLPELDDPDKAGRLEITDAEGASFVLDEVLAAAHLDQGGVGGELIDFFADDLNASASLKGAVDRTNELPPPQVFKVFFGSDETTLTAADDGVTELMAELRGRSPDEPLRIALSGHADCVGPDWYNQLVSEARVRTVFEEVIRPTLLEQGFEQAALDDKKRFKLAGLGEKAPAVEPGARCAASEPNRRVVVVVQ